jgi:hypothetical protein
MRFAIAVAAGLISLACVGENVSAQLSEESIYTYIIQLSNRVNACDADWLEKQLLDTAVIRFYRSDGTKQQLGAKEYIQHIRHGCYENWYGLRWDQSAIQMRHNGSRAVVSWQLQWGKRQGKTDKYKLRIKARTEITSDASQRIRIVSLEERTEELVPGAEVAYYRALVGGGSLMDTARDLWEATLKLLGAKHLSMEPYGDSGKH